ncbi:TBC1 domain family member 1 [Gossypium australe]|uniref:TBC1 domain family member 1 n=1 Tax=Gossypium australe TaxID=47621 RepID=A0A5B6UWQ4_9ROSI|nr:TBC1 domain family member 1 [Gossypium australe]
MGKSQSSASKKLKKYNDCSTTSVGYSGRDRGSQRSNLRSPSPSMTSVGSTSKPSNPASKGRPPRHPSNVSGSQTKDSIVKSEARVPARTYAIHAREDASTPDVITDTFSLLNTDIIALIDPGSTHSYICTNLVSVKNLPVEFTEFLVKVSNPLGQYVMVDKLTQHDAVVNCKQKYIVLKCQNSELLHVEFDKLDGLSNVISAISVQKYIRKGYGVYLAYVLDTKVFESKIKLVLVACQFPDFFWKNYLDYH